MTTTQEAPRRGRPPMDWLTWERMVELPAGTAVLVDRGQHEVRTVGRLMRRGGDSAQLRRRDGGVETVRRADFERARLVPGLFDSGDPVLLRGRSDQEWRGGVVRVGDGADRGMVLVETLTGTSWIHEGDLEHADDRAEALIAAGRLKPGPVAEDHAVEAANQEAFARGR